jgi:hypothetical protein
VHDVGVGLNLARVDRHARRGKVMTQKPELLPPELALGALREQLAPAEDLQHLRHIHEMLFERW